MDTLYLISLLVGGFFVLLSLFGGSDTDADLDADFDADVEGDLDMGPGTDADLDLGDPGAGPGFVDLLSVRSLFLFAAFFGLNGLLLSWAGTGEPFTAILSVLVGLIVGLGGNYLIKRIGYERVSSNVSSRDLRGLTGKVMIPFEGNDKGKITLVARGNRLQLVARAFGGEPAEPFRAGDEVVVVHVDGSGAEVVKPT